MTLDHAQREAKKIVGNAVARAYGFRPTDDFADACSTCHGDGEIPVFSGRGVAGYDPQCTDVVRCPDCGGTGEKAA